MRQHLAWPLAAPLAALGALAGHTFGYRIAIPDAHERAHVLAASGHGWLLYGPLLAGLLGALLVLGFVAMLRRPGAARAPVWLIALLPPSAFVLQEYVERFTWHGEVQWTTVTELAFLVGLALQLPFALTAAALAWLLGRAAHELARRTTRGAPPRRLLPLPLPPSLPAFALLRPPVLARGYAGRGPPRAR